MSSNLTQVLDLFLSLQATKTSAESIAAFDLLVSNIEAVKHTLTKVRFIENIEAALAKFKLTSVTIEYSYESDDEGGAYLSFYTTNAAFVDGHEFNQSKDKLYDVADGLMLYLLSNDEAIDLIASGPISIEKIPTIISSLLQDKEKEILQYFKIKEEHSNLTLVTPPALEEGSIASSSFKV